DIDAVAHEVAVFLFDHIAEMDADAILDALFWRQPRVALGQTALDFDGASHRVHYAAKLNDAAVAGALNNAAVMHSDGRVDQVAPTGAEPSEDAIFICARKPGVADDVSD